ncbi:MAG: methionyl-tRNA formyltransferase [Chloroflexi bacterium]|nr:methionyl-tRNA formyltransferase [Chloroflexota bacterium]
MRIVFMGSPDFALPTLRRVHQAGHDVRLVVSQPDRPVKRSSAPVPPPVALEAATLGLPLYQPAALRTPHEQQPLRDAQPDAIVVAAYGLLLSRAVLEIPPYGCLNVHPSLLPRWRGASPVQAALLAGDTGTGVTIIRLVRAMDAGPVLAQRHSPILDDDDAQSLEARLAILGADLLVETLDRLAGGSLVGTPQDDTLATYCGKLEREQGQIDWRRSAATIRNQVRAFRGRGDAFSRWDGKLLKILSARLAPLDAGAPGQVASLGQGGRRRPVVVTGEGALELLEVALEGRKPTSGEAFLRGYPAFLGTHLETAGPSSPLV